LWRFFYFTQYPTLSAKAISEKMAEKTFPKKAIVAGIPAKVISQRQNSLQYKLDFHPAFR
jgi:hypothetical protein